MTDTATATSAPAAPACAGGACCSCPCAARVCKLEKTVRRIRIALWISLGVFIFLLGIAIGSGGAKKEMMDHMRMMDAHRAGGQPGPQGPMGPGPDGRQEPRRDERRR